MVRRRLARWTATKDDTSKKVMRHPARPPRHTLEQGEPLANLRDSTAMQDGWTPTRSDSSKRIDAGGQLQGQNTVAYAVMGGSSQSHAQGWGEPSALP